MCKGHDLQAHHALSAAIAKGSALRGVCFSRCRTLLTAQGKEPLYTNVLLAMGLAWFLDGHRGGLHTDAAGNRMVRLCSMQQQRPEMHQRPRCVAHARRRPNHLGTQTWQGHRPRPRPAGESHGCSANHCCISSSEGMYFVCAWPDNESARANQAPKNASAQRTPRLFW